MYQPIAAEIARQRVDDLVRQGAVERRASAVHARPAPRRRWVPVSVLRPRRAV